MVGNESPKREKKPNKGRKATPREVEAGRANLIAYRARVGGKTALQSGVYSVIRNGEVPEAVPGAAEIEQAVGSIIDGFIADLGGSENVTNSQRVILSGLRLSLLVQALVESELKRTGIVDRRRRPNALLKTAATFINSARLGAVALGLERKARDAKTLDARLAEIAEREQAEEMDPKNDPENNPTPKA
jgi:hypothetical protein